jgi:tetratricopeptide (TPR) repeat protein
MKDLVFRVLGRDNNEIGNNLEDLAKELLARTGFGSFIRNAYKTGAEIDLRATHRVTGSPLLCECKAKRAPLDTSAVRLFYSEWEKQRTIDNRLVGLVISASGFTGTASQWHEELSDEKKRNFRLINTEELLNQLIECNLTLSANAILASLNRRFDIGQFHQASVLYSSHGLSWICEYSIEGRPKFFTIVDGMGEPLPNWKCLEVVKLLSEDVCDLTLLGIDVRQKVQTELLKREDVSAVELSKSIEESETDVAIALNLLLDHGIISKKQGEVDTFCFVRDVIPFVTTAREFLESENAVLFLRSKYVQEMIYSPPFLSYIDNRYQLDMSDKERQVTSQILCFSPSALRHALFQNNERFLQTRQDIDRVVKDAVEKEKWLALQRTSLLQELVVRAAHDLSGKEYSLSGHLSDLGIKRYRLKMSIDATGDDWKRLSIYAELMAAIEKAGETLSAGNLVSASDPVDAKMADAMFFLEVEEYDSAIAKFQQALDLCRSGTMSVRNHQAVLNNFALVYMRQQDWNAAAELLAEALSLGKPVFPEILSNKLTCHTNQPDYDAGKNLLDNAAVLFPAIEDNAAFVAAREAFFHKARHPRNSIDGHI